MATGCGDGAARVWDTATGHPIGLPLLHHGPVRAVAFRPAARNAEATRSRCLLVTGSEDMTAQVWEIPAPQSHSPGRIARSIQADTGMFVDLEDIADALAPEAWRSLRQELSDADHLSTRAEVVP
jgi:WD40 repeat protein